MCNDRVGNRFFQHLENPNGPTVIISPPYRQINYIYLQCLAWRFVREGYNAVIHEAPYHMGRTPPRENPGQGVLSADLVRCLKSMRQAVKDITGLIAALRAQGTQDITLYGASLGGLITGLATCHDPELTASVLVVPAVAPGKILFTTWIMRRIARNLRRLGYTMDEAIAMLNLADIANFHPAISPERILIVKGNHDTVVPPHDTERLWRSWGQGPILRVPQGHLSTILLEPKLFPTIFEFLRNVREKGTPGETA